MNDAPPPPAMATFCLIAGILLFILAPLAERLPDGLLPVNGKWRRLLLRAIGGLLWMGGLLVFNSFQLLTLTLFIALAAGIGRMLRTAYRWVPPETRDKGRP